MSFAIKNTIRMGQMAGRRFAHGSKLEKISPNLPEHTRKFKELQQLYQKDDGIPIHLKRGTRDKVLYYFTLTLCVVGLEESARFFYSLK